MKSEVFTAVKIEIMVFQFLSLVRDYQPVGRTSVFRVKMKLHPADADSRFRRNADYQRRYCTGDVTQKITI
jgi:hypothetical protein